jgi:hypothetical protein
MSCHIFVAGYGYTDVNCSDAEFNRNGQDLRESERDYQRRIEKLIEEMESSDHVQSVDSVVQQDAIVRRRTDHDHGHSHDHGHHDHGVFLMNWYCDSI